jgi:hypothetical protein
MARWHLCNVLNVGADARRLWQFDARNTKFALNREQTSFPGEPLPAKLIRKNWSTLWQRKLNVAWLPPEHVFLRIIQLPRASFEETLSMVELQLEKLSPMPVTHVVWSVQLLPHPAENMQTAIVVIAARDVVEEFLGKLEEQGYLADRLELPLLDQLQATTVSGNGAWVYPETFAGKNNALVAWWYDGVLHNLDLVSLPAGEERVAGLRDQLTQMTWAGELEGWLSSPPRWHLIADAATAQEWEPALRLAMDQPIEVSEPLSPAQLAALTAKRAAQSDPKSNLLPQEFLTRYQQQFHDRLWMRGLLALGGVYLVGLMIYLVALAVFDFRAGGVEKQAKALSGSYTNAIQLKAKYEVLKDRQELKFAALDCWRATAELMPESLSLDSMNFSDGRKLMLAGTAPGDQIGAVIDFNSGMRKYSVNGQQLFDPGKGTPLATRMLNPNTASWNFTLELKRTEVQ